MDNLKQWADIAYKTEEWLAQSERKRNCVYNICRWGRKQPLCSVPNFECEKCKAFNYMPLGLDSLVSGGFAGIDRIQHGGHK